jgi:hypothetical protein
LTTQFDPFEHQPSNGDCTVEFTLAKLKQFWCAERALANAAQDYEHEHELYWILADFGVINPRESVEYKVSIMSGARTCQ